MEKIKLLVLGSNGMLGHVTRRYLEDTDKYEIHTTTRGEPKEDNQHYFDAITNLDSIALLIQTIRPKFVINCIGVLVNDSQLNPKNAFLANSLLPNYIGLIIKNSDVKLIHISTDCVFSGEKGPYLENDLKDETNTYGMSKNIGEIHNSTNCLTIRTSIIGPEIRSKTTGLFNWVLKNKHQTIKGYKNATWSGLTTLELSRFIHYVIQKNFHPKTIIHATNNIAISKYDLLQEIIEIFNLDIVLEEENNYHVNKQLINTKELGFAFKGYHEMLVDLKKWIKDNEAVYSKTIQ